MSNHPIHQKRSMTYQLTDKAILLSDTKFHENNLQLLFNILRDNLYPSEFIQVNITKRINLINNNNSNTTQKTLIDTKKVIDLPFLKILLMI